MAFIKEFKEFASKGNVLDLAVGVIIGAAFGKIVSAAVNDLIMPLVGLFVGGVNFKNIKIILKNAVTDANGKIIAEAVTINVGNFLQAVFDFLMVALIVFLIIKSLNKLKRKEVAKEEEPKEPSNQEKILEEIRDILKSKNA